MLEGERCAVSSQSSPLNVSHSPLLCHNSRVILAAWDRAQVSHRRFVSGWSLQIAPFKKDCGFMIRVPKVVHLPGHGASRGGNVRAIHDGVRHPLVCTISHRKQWRGCLVPVSRFFLKSHPATLLRGEGVEGFGPTGAGGLQRRQRPGFNGPSRLTVLLSRRSRSTLPLFLDMTLFS